MPAFDTSESLRSRRKLLNTMLSAAGMSTTALLGFKPRTAHAEAPTGVKTRVGPTQSQLNVPEEFFALARLRNYKSRRSSSWDRTGGNADWITMDPGYTAALFDVTGAGVITHIWITISSLDPMHLKNLVLRAWWDGESSPSVEVPIGDFFGLGLGEYFVYQSALLAVAPVRSLNSYSKCHFRPRNVWP